MGGKLKLIFMEHNDYLSSNDFIMITRSDIYLVE